MSEGPDLPEVGPWAKDKLDRLRKYLIPYTNIMKSQKWARYIYVDAFAGTGRAHLRAARPTDHETLLFDFGENLQGDSDARELLDGSPRVALEIPHPFTRYVFIERDPKRLPQLRSLEKEYLGRRSISIWDGDCNEYLEAELICNPGVDWANWRAVVFLDPFGMHVPWKTIVGLASTHAIEVFLNLPIGMAIQRLLKRNDRFSEKERVKLDDYFGDPAWYDIVYQESPGLFGPVQSKARNTEDRLVTWYRNRLKHAFGYVSSAYLVRNTHGGHLYFLLFAGPNATGARIASHVLAGGVRI
jgi:three-Cys-motif partner protein